MTEEQKKKIENKIMFLSIGIIAILIVFLILIGVTQNADSIIFPVVVALFLAAFWAVTDVLPIIWMKQFEGKTDKQKKSYYVYAGMDLIGLGGLVYFLVDMNSTTGAIIYVACLFLKKRFRDEFYGTAKEEEDDEEESAGSETAGELAEGSESLAEITAEEQEAEGLQEAGSEEQEPESSEEAKQEEQPSEAAEEEK